MIVEARYTGGAGVLLGSGAHWVLMTDPGDEQVVEEVWDALSMTAPSGAGVVERVLAIVEKAFAGDPPGLAVVDFTSGASTTLSRGAGHVRLSGPARVLSLDGGTDPEGLSSTRRLVGGVVAADRVELRPLSVRTAPPVQHAEAAAAPAPAGAPLIDGIPAAILAAKGPDGPPPRTRTMRPAQDTGSLTDTSEPDPLLVQRIEEGAHTTIRPASAPHTTHEPDDHDGSTTFRPAHLSHPHRADGARGELPARPPHAARPRRSAASATSGSPRRSRGAWTGRRSAACACRPARSCRSTVA